MLQNFVEKHYPLPKDTNLNGSKNSRFSWPSMEESDLSDFESSDASEEMDSDGMVLSWSMRRIFNSC